LGPGRWGSSLDPRLRLRAGRMSRLLARCPVETGLRPGEPSQLRRPPDQGFALAQLGQPLKDCYRDRGRRDMLASSPNHPRWPLPKAPWSSSSSGALFAAGTAHLRYQNCDQPVYCVRMTTGRPAGCSGSFGEPTPRSHCPAGRTLLTPAQKRTSGPR
jgi:hypothetical protein